MASLAMYTVYHSPNGHTGLYVVRRFSIVDGSPKPVADPEPMFIGPSLEAARKAIPPEAEVCMPRHSSDEASIVETWL
jgi:hypothetical protein